MWQNSEMGWAPPNASLSWTLFTVSRLHTEGHWNPANAALSFLSFSWLPSAVRAVCPPLGPPTRPCPPCKACAAAAPVWTCLPTRVRGPGARTVPSTNGTVKTCSFKATPRGLHLSIVLIGQCQQILQAWLFLLDQYLTPRGCSPISEDWTRSLLRPLLNLNLQGWGIGLYFIETPPMMNPP